MTWSIILTLKYRQKVGRFGGARRDRTADLLHAMQALSQLSYSPTQGTNLREPSHTVKRRESIRRINNKYFTGFAFLCL